MLTARQRIASRETFEKLAIERSWFKPLYKLERMAHGGYLDLYLQLRWEGWQEAIEFMEGN